MTAPPQADALSRALAGLHDGGSLDWEAVSTHPNTYGDYETRYTAIIDIGSGSARAVVMQVNPGGGIEMVAQQRLNLNLMSHVGIDSVLDASGVASTLDALEDFAQVARGFGVDSIHAVGTAALRESANASAVLKAAEDRFGINLEIIDGGDEAAHCFIGAIHGLPVSDGMLADIGGGSTEIVQFNGRAMGSSVSLPLGSLRIANQFRLTDLPKAEDMDDAHEYIHATLHEAGVPRLLPGESLVGSGGSVRLLSRLDRGREPYPIIKVHGYQIEANNLAEHARGLASMSCVERAGTSGMNPERSHSIVGGAVVAHALAQYVNADSILVSGQGLREGLARQSDCLFTENAVSVPPVASVRIASLTDLASRFVPRFHLRGRRRAALASRVGASAWESGERHMRWPLECAAYLLDIGNAIDFYNRLNRTASIIVRTDLPGFTHRESAYVAAILLTADRGRVPARFRRSRLLSGNDANLIEQAAAALTLVDELDNHLPLECPASVVQVGRQHGIFTVATPVWSRVAGPQIKEWWDAAFGEEINIMRCES
ncbi:MAG: Ppx/GppA family phosphatase [Chloroflexi bacterium]|nr:Ppx/GppA family phosphatase [Chloroflexota bacterium]